MLILGMQETPWLRSVRIRFNFQFQTCGWDWIQSHTNRERISALDSLMWPRDLLAVAMLDRYGTQYRKKIESFKP